MVEKDFYLTGPGTPVGRYLRKFWHPVSVSDWLKPGRAVPIRIMNEDFTLYRGEGGTPHVVAFRCAHRGTQLSVGWVEGDCIRCRYHGWKYDSSGQCVEQAGEDKTFASKVRIASYPTKEYIGLIFAFLGGEEPAPFPRYPDFEKEGAIIWSNGYLRPCNFINGLENDPSHVLYTHKGSEIFYNRPFEPYTKITAEETEWGVRIYVTYPSQTRISDHGMPNVVFLRTHERDHLSWKVPVDDYNTRSFQANLMRITKGEEARIYELRQAERRKEELQTHTYAEQGEAVLRGELAIEDIKDRASLIWVQDYVTQVGQGHPKDHRTNERLGQSDAGVILHRKLWERELRALAEGQPLTKWERTPRLFPDS